MKRLLFGVTLCSLASAFAFVIPGWAPAADDKDASWGSVKGQLVIGALIDGKVPPRKQLDVNKDQEHCLSKGPLLSDEWVVNPETKGVQWVFVWLAPEKGGSPLPIHPSLKEIKEKDVVLDQPTCKFEPHALAIRQGQDVIAKNSAPVAHNVHWTGHPLKNPGNNVIVPSGQSITIKDLKADRFPVEVKCDIHGWMKGWIRVYDHPYFAVTDQNGMFGFKLAPAGQYRLMTWHDSGYGPGGRDGSPITIKGGAETNVGQLKMEYKP